MPIALASSNGGTGTSISLECFAENALLCVFVTAGAVSTCTYNSIALTKHASSDTNRELWYLWNPPVGTYNVVVNTNPQYISCACFTGVDAGSGILATSTGGDVSTNTLTLTVSDILEGDCVIEICEGDYGQLSLTTGTLIKQEPGATPHHISAYRLATGTSQSIAIDGDDNKHGLMIAVRDIAYGGNWVITG